MHRFVACLVLLTSSAAVAQQQQDDACRIVVLNLVAKNLAAADAEVPAVLTSSLAQQVSVDSGCRVVTQVDLVEMLDFEAAKMGCTDGADSCLAEIGSAMGAERVIGGSLSRLGNDFILNARLMNVQSGVVEARAEQVVPGVRERLRIAAQNISHQLFGKPIVVDTATPPVAAGAPKTTAGPSPLLLVGGGIGVVGIAAGVIGGIVVAGAENTLSTPAATDKQAAQTTGRIGVAVIGLGTALVLGGAVVALVPVVVE